MAQKTNRIIFNILAKDIEVTARFYEQLCGLERIYTSDWYIVLTPGGELAYELGIIDEVSEFVPKAARGLFAGGYLTLVVDDVWAAYDRAREMDVEVVSLPTDMEYGQTQMVLRDPNNVVLDFSTPTKQEWG